MYSYQWWAQIQIRICKFSIQYRFGFEFATHGFVPTSGQLHLLTLNSTHFSLSSYKSIQFTSSKAINMSCQTRQERTNRQTDRELAVLSFATLSKGYSIWNPQAGRTGKFHRNGQTNTVRQTDSLRWMLPSAFSPCFAKATWSIIKGFYVKWYCFVSLLDERYICYLDQTTSSKHACSHFLSDLHISNQQQSLVTYQMPADWLIYQSIQLRKS